MTDTYDNYDSFDPRYLEEQQRRQAASSLIGASEDDPEKAARAVELGGATGVDPSLIHSDLEAFEQQQKIAVNNKLIGDNLFLQNYLNSHPMAAALSHDDLGQLDAASQAISAIPSKSFVQQAQDFLKSDRVSRGALHGWGDAPLGYALLPDKPFAKTGNPILDTWYQFAEATARAEVTLPEIALRGINAAIFGTAYGLLGEEQGEKLGQMVTDPGLQMTLQGQGPHGALVASFQAALRSVSPWLRAGKDIPAGIHPEIDKLKIEQAKVDGDALSDALKESTKSATRERSADYFATFAKGHPEANREMGISVDAVRELYGDKQPLPDDKLLGWIPNITEKLATAEATGGDVRVPMADFLAKVDPEVAKTLHDHLRIRDGGITIDEGKLLEPKESVPEPLSALRATGGLEPLFSNGDRKIKIERAKGNEATGHGGFHDFNLLDETGKPIGSINLSEQNGGKQLYIEMIQAGADKRMYDPNFLGYALIKDIKRQLKAEFPNAETITGHRVSGAREKSGSFNDPSATPVVKLSEEPAAWGKADTTAVDLRSLFEGAAPQTIPTSGSLLHYDPALAPHKAAMDVAIREELARIAGPQAKVFTPDSISVPNRPDIARGGFFQQFREQDPWIVVALDSKDPLGPARHEAVHHLRQQGFFDASEWSTLTRAARDQGWLEKHDIATRYPDLSMSSKLEEAIAEGYRTWKAGASVPKDVHAIFEKLKAFFESLRTRLKEITGRDLSWEEIFKKVDEGEVAAREGNVPIRAGAFRQEPSYSLGDKGDNVGSQLELALRDAGMPKSDASYHSAGAEDYKTGLWTRIPLDELQGLDQAKVKKLMRDFKTERRGNDLLVRVREYGRDGRLGLDPLASDELHTDIGGDAVEKLRERITALSSELNVAKGQGFDIHSPEFSDRTTALREAQSSLRDLTSGAFGITVKDFENYQRLMAKRHAEDLEASTKRALAQQKQMQTKEWKADRTEMRDTVREELEGRPDLAVDAMMSSEKLKFHPDFLTDEQKAALPKEFIQKKNGINPDDAAGYFGYHSGDAMIDRLAMITADRKAAGMSSREWLNHLIDTETDRRMQEKYGNLDERILEEAKDQALSENQLNIVHQEMLFLGMLAKEPFPLTKQRLRQELKSLFDKTPIGTISTDAYLRDSGKAERAIQSALLEGDIQGAFREGQRRNNAQIMASYAKAYEKARKSFDRTAKTFAKREVPSVPAEWTNWIHDIMLRTGNRVNRSIQDLSENIARQSEKTLADFVEAKEAETFGERETTVAEYLLDPNFRTEMDNLTAKQFFDLKQSIDVLAKQGRDEKKIYAAGEAADVDQVRAEMRTKLSTFPKQLLPDERGWLAEKMQDPRKFIAGLTAIPTLLHRWDRADPRGVFNRYLNYPLRRAANTENVLQRETSKSLNDLGPVKDGNKLVDAPFADPLTRDEANPQGRAWPGFTRNHVLGLLQNAGNRSNWRVLAKGYSTDPDALMQWLFRNTTKEDWDRAQKVGDTIFKPLIDKADTVRENVSGMIVEKIPLEPVDTPFGQYAGWYHPLVADPLRKEVWVKQEDGTWKRNATGKREGVMDKYGHSYATTADGYTRKRTGAIYPVDLDVSTMNRTINQMIHDISYRGTLLEAQKILFNRAFQAEVTKHYGAEYTELLEPYLQEMAGQSSVPGPTQKWVGEWSEFLRQNVISTYIGFNPYTAMKHGPTALVMSSAEVGAGRFLPQFGKQLLERLAGDPLRKALDIVGADNFANAVKGLYARSPELGLTMSEFAMKHSESLQRRERHWQDTIAGETRVLEGATTARERVIQAGSWLVAQSDMLSAKPTWIAEYNKRIAEGSSHGEAIDLADSAVDRAHGSTARTNQPALVRGGGPAHSWLTSVYGFMGTRMQRMIELGHQLNDIHHLGMEGELAEAAKRIPKLLTNAMSFAIWPIIVEEAVQAINNEDHHTYGTRIASALTMGMSSSVLYLRDIIHGLASDHEPGVGLLSSAAHDLKKGAVDLFKGREAFNKQHAGKTVGDILTILGETKGVAPKVIGNAARFGIDLVNKQQRPKDFMDYFRGVTRGDMKKREVH